MAYTIPNDSDPAYLDTEYQSRWFAADIDILQAGIAGRNGVVGGGCGVTADSPASMDVVVASGSIAVDGVLHVIAGGDVTLDAADPTEPRFDLIVARSDGTVGSVTGSPDLSPLLPTPVAGTVALAAVFVPDGDLAIQTNQIVDKRISVTDPTVPSTGWTTVAPTTDVTRATQSTMTADPALTFVVAPSTKYRIRMHASWRQNVANNAVKVGFGGPASPTMLFGIGGFMTNIPPGGFNATTWQGTYLSGYDTTTGIQFSLPTLNYSAGITMEIILHNGANAGNFALWWSQVTSNANSITRHAGSYIEYRTV